MAETGNDQRETVYLDDIVNMPNVPSAQGPGGFKPGLQNSGTPGETERKGLERSGDYPLKSLDSQVPG